MIPTDEQVLEIKHQMDKLFNANRPYYEKVPLSIVDAYRLAVMINLGQSLDDNTAAIMMDNGWVPIPEPK